MARLARVVVPGMPHHIVQRGNRRLDVFFREEDRVAYIRLLREAARKHGVHIWAYCLMRNHVHIIAVPSQEEALADCFAETHVRYTRRVNVREGWQGHLWQARFGSSVLDEQYLIAAVRYVERNPVQAGIVRLPWQYRWSSARWHVGDASSDPLVSGDETLRNLVGNWREYLSSEEQQEHVQAIEANVYVNRPLGSMAFVRELEQRFHRPLTRGRRGRPRLTKK